jgi:hypothetical protein
VEIALVVAAFAAWAGVLAGGSLDSLAATKLVASPLLFAGFALQLLFTFWQPSWMTTELSLAVLVSSNLLVGLFVWLNRRLPGILLAGTGLVLNLLVISLNGAMPVSADAARIAGGAQGLENADSKHDVLNDDTLLPWLSDVLPVPGVGLVLSVGDVVLVLGIARLTYARTKAGDRTSEASG